MCLTFHVDERFHDSEKALFLHSEFDKLISQVTSHQYCTNHVQ